MLSVMLPDSMAEPLQAACEETGGTLSQLVVEAVERYLRELEEDRQDVKTARLALEEYEQNGGGIPLDDFARELGIRV
ncbi:MAG: hypothetical protein HQL56_16325 [Magnetococcales bacterium]|nr:hypothetical protein [Magnetococcales bacterium]